MFAALCATFLLFACNMQSQVTPEPVVDDSNILDETGPADDSNSGPIGGKIHGAAAAARADLAARLSVDPDSIGIEDFIAADWPDACLGLPEEGEMCAQVITPGYSVLLEHNGTQYGYRTNMDGSVVKAET